MDVVKAKTDEMRDTLNRIGKRLLAAEYQHMRDAHYAMMGYSPLEEAMWRRFNRCCHNGRRIEIKARTLRYRAGKVGDLIRIRVPKLSDAVARDIIVAAHKEPTSTPNADGEK